MRTRLSPRGARSLVALVLSLWLASPAEGHAQVADEGGEDATPASGEETPPEREQRSQPGTGPTAAPLAIPPVDAPLDAYAALYAQLARGREGGQRAAFGLPGLDVVIGGVAELLISRAEAEAEQYGIETLHEELCGVDAVGALLPTTCDLLRGMVEAGGGPSGRARLDALLAAVRADVATLPTGIVRAVLVSVEGADLEVPRLWLALVAEIIDGVRAGVEPEELMDRLFRVAIACDVRAEALDEVRACVSDEGRTAQRGLLYATMLARGTISRSLDAENVAAFFRLDPETAEAARLTEATARLVRSVRQLQRAVRDASDPEAGEETRRQHALSVARRLARLVMDADAAVGVLTRQHRPTHRQRDAVHDVVERLLDLGSLGPNEALAQSLALLRVVIDYASENAELRALGSRVLRLSSRWMSAVSTAVSLAAAADADAVRAILEQLVAPVGSWRGKREGFMLSVTGLVGVSMLRDRLLADDPLHTWGIGLHASIGLDLNLVGGRAGTFGVYVALLDLGSIASVPFGLDVEREYLVDGELVEERVETKVQLLSVLSPGFFVRFGLGQTPFVIGGGASFVPEARVVRQVDANGDDERRALNALRFQVFLAIDTTLWVL